MAGIGGTVGRGAPVRRPDKPRRGTTRGGHFQEIWNSRYPSQSSFSVITGQYMGRDAAGNALYRITARSPWRTTTTKTIAWTGSRGVDMQRAPRGGEEAPRQSSGTVYTEERKLRDAKDKWLAWISDPNNAISANDRQKFASMISNWNGPADRLDKRMHLASQNLPFGATATQGGDDFLSDIPGDGGGGFGGGGGFLGPQYRAPDRRVVEDLVKGMYASLVGTIPEDLVGPAVDIYMADHRRNFDSVDADIDPEMSVLEYIRGTSQYQAIHKLRPDSEDERTWIAQRKAAAERGGLDTAAQEEFAITQATVGGDIPDVQDAASLAQFQRSGTVQNTLLDTKLRGVVQTMFTGVR